MRTPILRALLSVAALFVLTAAHPSNAATSAPGVNLRWDQCYGDAGVWNKNFACDTNVGSESMVASFELDSDMQGLQGVELRLDIAADAVSLPAWWQFKNVGTCRSTSLAMAVTPPPGAANCVDWTNALAAGGIGAYQVGTFGANKAAIVAAMAVPADPVTNVLAGSEYFAGRFTINHAKTVGTGACAGCLTPVCIIFSSAKLTTSTPANDRFLTRGANYLGSQYVTWQSGYPINIVPQCQFNIVGCVNSRVNMDCVLATPTNSRGSTWGAVKALYR
jgi:hypothetical protein